MNDVVPAVLLACVLLADKLNAGSPAAWVTIIVCAGTPVAVTVTSATLGSIVLLTVAVKLSVASPVVAPAGSTLSHVWAVVAFHVVLDVTSASAVLPSDLEMLTADADTLSVGLPAAWVTVMVLDSEYAADAMVTVALRVDKPGLTPAVNVSVALPEPVGVFIVNHD